MRESIGGSWLFGIVATFIVLFSAFIAYSISYTKAFKVKNSILNYIEQNEGFTTSAIVDGISVDRLSNEELKDSKAVDAMAYELIKSMGYNTTEVSCEGYGEHQYGGYCVERKCLNTGKDSCSYENKGNQKVIFKVTTFIKANIPVINVEIKIPVMGETKTLYYVNDDSI